MAGGVIAAGALGVTFGTGLLGGLGSQALIFGPSHAWSILRERRKRVLVALPEIDATVQLQAWQLEQMHLAPVDRTFEL